MPDHSALRMMTRDPVSTPDLSEAAVRLSVRVIESPMTAGELLVALAREAGDVPSTPGDFRRRNFLLAGMEHFREGSYELARRDLVQARRGHDHPEVARVPPAGPADRPYIGFDPSTNLVWGAGRSLAECQARAGWGVVEARRPDLMAHLRWMPAGPGMIEAVSVYGADVPWERNMAGQAVPEEAWKVRRMPVVALPEGAVAITGV